MILIYYQRTDAFSTLDVFMTMRYIHRLVTYLNDEFLHQLCTFSQKWMLMCS